MSGELQLTLLGQVGVSQDGVSLAGWSQRKSLALLGYLAVTGRPHSRAALAGLLWGEVTEANARAYLRQVLAELRRRLSAHLTITRSQVALNRGASYWLDVEAFERRVGEGLGEGSGRLTRAGATALAEAADLYRGDFFEGLFVRHAPAFEEWVRLERERLRLHALRALHALAEHQAARGAYGPAIDTLSRLLLLEPMQEGAHRELMHLLALSGQEGAALRQYWVCCRVLADELGVEPDAETTALYERILARELESEGAKAPSRAQPAHAPHPLDRARYGLGRDY